MKKLFLFLIIISVQGLSQSRFGLEADGGVDLISSPNTSSTSLDNGYSLTVSPIYYFNKTISVFGVFTFHRAEGAVNNGGTALAAGYSIDNPYKPNDYAYELALGLRANFSDKIVKPYFVIRTGFLFTNLAMFSVYYSDFTGNYADGWVRKHSLALYIYRQDWV